ncbi:toll/interleukin-1 receptor domain-containing protein [Nitrosomonas communis]|uniref:toll/interleukin-1 receptor domain-containing protein n=1 Tax=Nitrosomonas communis TaxID=44574 RepID=UPI003D27F5D5
MKERHWTSLVTSIRHGQSVLVLGREIPARVESGAQQGDSNMSDALTAKLVAELEEDNRRVIGDSLPAVAQQYEDADGFGANALRALAEKFYKSPNYAPSQTHAALATLPFSLILTTCQDDLLTRALREAGKDPVVCRYNLRGDKRDNPEIVLSGLPQSPLVFHLFGDAQAPSSLVLSENDLLDFLIAIASERPPLPDSLVRALKRAGQSFLFVGFGIKNWYLRVLLKIFVRVLELNRTSEAIATEPLHGLSQYDREQTVLFYQRGARIEVEDTDIPTFLGELSHRIETEGGVVEQAFSFCSRPRVFISYAREDNDLAIKVFDTLQKSGFEPWCDKESLTGGDLWNERIQEELNATDFILVLYTPVLCAKIDSYVNKEINLARQRALNVRGSFLIPLQTAEIAPENRIHELSGYQEMSLRPANFDEDISKVISTMRRDYQRRLR